MALLEMSYEKFSKAFDYANGKLIRKQKTTRNEAGSVVGTKNKKGYLIVKFDNVTYLVHRIIYLLIHKKCPDFIDHVNGNKTDNRIDNLRPADISTNHYNCKMYANNKSGIKGVYWHSSNKRWAVKISANGCKMHIGCFDDLEFAELVANEASNKFHGKYANYGVAA